MSLGKLQITQVAIGVSVHKWCWLTVYFGDLLVQRKSDMDLGGGGWKKCTSLAILHP